MDELMGHIDPYCAGYKSNGADQAHLFRQREFMGGNPPTTPEDQENMEDRVELEGEVVDPQAPSGWSDPSGAENGIHCRYDHE